MTLRIFGASTVFATLLLVGCSDQAQIQRTLKAVGAAKLRQESIASCGNEFPREGFVKIAEATWPPSVRAFRPMSVWTEPDGVYILLDTDAAAERGVFVPRVITEKDPVCGPKLLHVKLDSGVYWYERKR
jgi:hypothetical protein